MSKDAVKKWLSKIGKKGGKVKSEAKAKAARRNAKLPRKKRPGQKTEGR